MLRACIDCGSLSDQPHCPKHRGKSRNGSTRAWRKIRAAVLKRDNYICFYCGRKATTVDHLLPVSRGGSDEEENLVAACAAHNGAKGDLTPAEFGY
jgi:5-methylcytosine-specific restriction endonuclease McrA